MLLTARFGRRVADWVDAYDPFTEVYGVARSILAFATALTLIATRNDVLFSPGQGVQDVPQCPGIRGAGLFCLFGRSHLQLAQALCVVLLLVIASGWRPRITGVVHAFIAFSFQANAMMIEGGDQVSGILTLLLVPVTLLDDRTWHWLPPKVRPLDEKERRRRLIARACFLLIRLQVAGIYFHASIAKFSVPEWTDGTVLYYWLNHPTYGTPAWLRPLIQPILLNAYSVAMLTWSVLIVEWALSAGLLVEKRYRRILLVLGFMLHLGIALVHGLVTFSMTMWAALILYLRPLEQPFGAGVVFERLRAKVRSRLPTSASRPSH